MLVADAVYWDTKFQAHRDHITALHFAPDGTLYVQECESMYQAVIMMLTGWMGIRA